MVPPSPGHGTALVGGWNAERGASGNTDELPEGDAADRAAAQLDMLTSESIGQLEVADDLVNGVAESERPAVRALITQLHSHGIVKGYANGNAVPLPHATHLRFLVGGTETITLDD